MYMSNLIKPLFIKKNPALVAKVVVIYCSNHVHSVKNQTKILARLFRQALIEFYRVQECCDLFQGQPYVNPFTLLERFSWNQCKYF